jgi:hypothetical protein
MSPDGQKWFLPFINGHLNLLQLIIHNFEVSYPVDSVHQVKRLGISWLTNLLGVRRNHGGPYRRWPFIQEIVIFLQHINFALLVRNQAVVVCDGLNDGALILNVFIVDYEVVVWALRTSILVNVETMVLLIVFSSVHVGHVDRVQAIDWIIWYCLLHIYIFFI